MQNFPNNIALTSFHIASDFIIFAAFVKASGHL